MELLESHGKLLLGKPIQFLFPGDERLQKSQYEGDWTIEQHRLAWEDGIICFDMFAVLVADMLDGSNSLTALLGSAYPLVIVDEFQDTDDDQWRIVKALSDKTMIFCLADPDQRIFDYRDTVDPLRLEYAKSTLHPAEFDLSSDNHRSPASGILNFANAILHNSSPLPSTENVKQLTYTGGDFASVVHLAVLGTLRKLHEQGITTPTLAVLARTNALIAQLSGILYESHQYGIHILPPVEHDVVWDAELSAVAAIIVGSILEWSYERSSMTLAKTLQLIARFYEFKNAENPSITASENVRKFQDAAYNLLNGKSMRIKAARELQTIMIDGIDYAGDPVNDWKKARQVLSSIRALNEIYQAARMVRLFRLTDTLGSSLADLWFAEGAYVGAALLVQHTLEQEMLSGAEQDPEGCILMNMHKSKGKEFDGVVLVEGQYQAHFFDTRRKKPPYQQCRQLLRVGITRAKSFVTIVRPENAMLLVTPSHSSGV